jgi:hypothetical protein
LFAAATFHISAADTPAVEPAVVITSADVNTAEVTFLIKVLMYYIS